MTAPVLTLSSASTPSPCPTPVTDQRQPPSQLQPQPINGTGNLSSHILALTNLSRNTSVISTSSSSSASSSKQVITPVRPRPLRTFSNHSEASTSRARSPHTPTTPRLPAAYMPRDYDNDTRALTPVSPRRSPPPGGGPRSRSSSAARKQVHAVMGPDAFEFGEVLGHGSYSTVIQVTHRTTSKLYAMKVLDKEHIKREKKMKYPAIERQALTKLGGHPGVIRLHWAFQDTFSLYFTLSLATNGDLLDRILRLGSLSLTCVKFYTAELVDTVEFMHSKGVIHRDVKPENILLDEDMRIKLTDFGSARNLELGEDDDEWTGEGRKGSFVGSAIYASPELLLKSQAGKSADVWALANIIFYMIAGTPPFKAGSDYLAFERIKHLDYSFPEGFDEEARDLIQKILVIDPAQRPTMLEIRAHPFLADVNWMTIWTDPAPPLEHGMVKNEWKPAPAFDSDDEGDVWPESDEEAGTVGAHEMGGDDVEEADDELERVRRMYGATALQEHQEQQSQQPLAFPLSVADAEAETSPPAQPVEVAHQEQTILQPPLPVTPPSPPPQRQSGGFVVLSRPANRRPSSADDGRRPPPVSVAFPTRESRPEGSACSGTSSEGSPIEPVAPGTVLSTSPVSPLTPLTSVPAARRFSQSDSIGGLFGSLRAKGGRVLSSGGSRRGSTNTASSGGGTGGGSRRGSTSLTMASTSTGTTTNPESQSRSGSASGSSMMRRNLMADMDRWSHILLPSEQVLYSSPIYLKSRRSLLPAKRRVLVLTDLPRLLCVKEDRGARLSVKSDVVFSPTTNTKQQQQATTGPVGSGSAWPPPVLSKISEDGRSEDNVSLGGTHHGSGWTVTGTPLVGGSALAMTPVINPPTLDTTPPSPSVPTGDIERPAGNLLQTVDGKGDKSFTVRTVRKTYRYIAEDANAASRWVKEIEDVKKSFE